jgi:hypothetical protein
MLEHGAAEPAKYLRQLEDATVVWECECGCASINFQIGDQPPSRKAGICPIAEYEYGPKDLPYGAFVFTCDGMLAGLEVYSFGDAPAPLPRPEELRQFGAADATR